MASLHRWAARNLGEDPTTTEGVPQSTQSSSSGSSSGGLGGGGNNSLYLYTFLITLLILFGVSCGIVVRSIVLRRRFRQQIQIAIDTGMALPQHVAASRAGRRHQFGERPKMHEVWLDYKGIPQRKGGIVMDIDKVEVPWQIVKPISAIVLRPTDKVNQAEANQPILFTREVAAEYFGIDLRSTSEWGQDIMHSLISPFTLRRPRPRPRIIQPQPPTDPVGATSSPPSSTSNLQQDERQMMTVGIMIAMPDPSRRQYQPGRVSHLTASASLSLHVESQVRPPPAKTTADEEVELPDVAIGVIESDWTGKPAMARPPSAKKESHSSRHALRSYGRMRSDRERTDRETARRLRRTVQT
ncbi:hypothetical protein FRB98_003593 [Tulasnella sp. 332]|nr:hypothetical protein FRB98_003593 [Tulasnella sp. 332]